ncbi:MAG: helix-turn-helix transcriptional regulator [Armatimonadetes bacterium]|nr:helix-turn-helix transcriptional regulator [Armatimonadota bacterium]
MNAVVSGYAAGYETRDNVGTLSIKSVRSGGGVYTTPIGDHRLEPGRFLVLDEGRRYTLRTDTHQYSRTFAVFFRPGFAPMVRSEMMDVDPEGRRLPDRRLRFDACERLESFAPEVQVALDRLYRSAVVERDDAMAVEGDFIDLVASLTDYAAGAQVERARLSCARAAVREEVHFRLNRARDFLVESSGAVVRLADAARVAAMSPSHFHMLFSEAYGQTPHQFLTRLRVRQAVARLRTSEEPLWSIALSVGFASEAHMWRLVRRETGVAPGQLRRFQKIGQEPAG